MKFRNPCKYTRFSPVASRHPKKRTHFFQERQRSGSGKSTIRHNETFGPFVTIGIRIHSCNSRKTLFGNELFCGAHGDAATKKGIVTHPVTSTLTPQFPVWYK